MNTLLTSQRALLQALFGAASDAEALKTLTTDHAMPTRARGLKSYQSNAHMLSERVLLAADPLANFIDKNPSVRELMEVVKAEPLLAASFVQVAREQSALGLGPDVQPTGWASPTAQAAEDWLGQEVGVQKRARDSGMDFGM